MGSRRAARASSPPERATGRPIMAAPLREGSTHAESQTGKQAPGAAEEAPGTGEGLFPQQGEALSGGQRGRGSRRQLLLRRASPQEAGLPPPLDHPHQRRDPEPRSLL